MDYSNKIEVTVKWVMINFESKVCVCKGMEFATTHSLIPANKLNYNRDGGKINRMIQKDILDNEH